MLMIEAISEQQQAQVTLGVNASNQSSVQKKDFKTY